MCIGNTWFNPITAFCYTHPSSSTIPSILDSNVASCWATVPTSLFFLFDFYSTVVGSQIHSPPTTKAPVLSFILQITLSIVLSLSFLVRSITSKPFSSALYIKYWIVMPAFWISIALLADSSSTNLTVSSSSLYSCSSYVMLWSQDTWASPSSFRTWALLWAFCKGCALTSTNAPIACQLATSSKTNSFLLSTPPSPLNSSRIWDSLLLQFLIGLNKTPLFPGAILKGHQPDHN